MKTTKLEEIQRWRKISTEYGILGGTLFILFLSRFYLLVASAITGAPYVGSVIVSSMIYLLLSIGAFQKCHWFFMIAWAGFYSRSIDSMIGNLLDKNAVDDIPKEYIFSKWGFWKAKDLALYEKLVMNYLVSYRKAQELIKRNKRWKQANMIIDSRFHGVLKGFQLTSDERDDIFLKLQGYANPRKRRDVINGLTAKLIHDEWLRKQKSTPASNPQSTVVRQTEEDFELAFLEEQASKVVSVLSQETYNRALLTNNRRERVRLLKSALYEDQLEEILSESKVSSDTNTPAQEDNKAEIRYASLQDFARNRLAPFRELVKKSDWVMCREIVIALAQFGQRGGRFNKHYRAEDTVKTMVRRQYEIYTDMDFRPRVFDSAVTYLLSEGIIVSKPKTDERTLSLSTRIKGNKPLESVRIIELILITKRDLSGIS